MKLTGKHYGIIVLALITAFLHLAAAMDKQLFPDGPDPLFLLNGLGYLGCWARISCRFHSCRKGMN